MRIAITHPYCWPEVRRGAERMIVETARSLAARGHEVTVLTASTEPGTTSVDGYLVRRFRRRFDERFRHERWFGLRILPALLRGRFDVVHSLMPPDAVAAIRTRRCGHRTVYEELGNPVRSAIEGRPDERARVRVIEDVDVYGCMSDFSRHFLEHDWGRDGVVIPGGVRTAEFGRRTRHPEPTVLFSGALDAPEKHVALLLEAVALVADVEPAIRLQLSGPGDTDALLAAAPAAARERAEVLPMGDPHDLADQYGAAWVTCLPTEWDSFGLVVIESWAAGTPVVVGPRGAPPETVGRFEGVGVAAGELGARSLADALLAGLDLARDPGCADRCLAAAAEFDWDGAIAPLLEQLYEAGP